MGGIAEKVRAVEWYDRGTKGDALSADDSMFLIDRAFLIALSISRDLAALIGPTV